MTLEQHKHPDEGPTFDALPLGEAVRRGLADMGFERPTPVQVGTYGPATSRKDVIVQARTGTGKTAAFGIPLVDRLVSEGQGAQALVLAPTRELALQSAREIERIAAHTDLRVLAVYGGAPIEPQVRALEAGVEILSGTPGRVLDHLERGTLDPTELKVLVLDEADEMLSMGFAEELNAIVDRLPDDRQTLLFSATVDNAVRRLADRLTRDPEFVEMSGDAVGALGIAHFVYMSLTSSRLQDLLRIIQAEDPPSAMIFCNTKVQTQQVAEALIQRGHGADWLSGDLPQRERERVMKRMRAGELRYLVGTDVAARGIDISHVTHVINYDFPEAIEQYVHRTGRTGRAGRTGTAISLVAPHELGSLYYLRLQYRIFPIERSLPTERELASRGEADRIHVLEKSVPFLPHSADRALARRLLTHPRAEELVAGLLGAFFSAEKSDRQPSEPAPESRSLSEVSKSESPEEGGQPEAHGDPTATTNLYVGAGRRDGLRPSMVRRIFEERAEVGRTDLHKVRIRDRHAFVTIPSHRVDDVLSRLEGVELNDKPLVIERAKGDG